MTRVLREPQFAVIPNGYNAFMKTLASLAAMIGALAQQPEPTIRVNVNLIQVDATVTDRAGKRVPDLTAKDFEVFREGKRQQIKSVLWVPGLRVGIPPVSTTPAPASSEAAAGGLKRQDVRRTVAIMIDDLSLTPASAYYARDALKKFVTDTVQADDLVAVYRTSSGFGLMQQFSANKRQLLASIERMGAVGMKAFDPLGAMSVSPLESNSNDAIANLALRAALREDVQRREQQDLQTAGMLGSVNLVARGLRELPGRKSLLLLSESIQLYDAPAAFFNSDLASQRANEQGGKRYRTEAALRSLIDAANRAGVMIYTIDPRGLVPLGLMPQDDVSGAANPQRVAGMLAARAADFNFSKDGMGILAEETGGRFFHDTNDITGAMRDALNDQEGYYLIAFQPDDETFDKAKNGPKFQRLTVKVKRSGTSVRYRHGFFGLPDQQGPPPNPLVSAVLSPFRSDEVGLNLTPIFLESSQTGPFLRTMLHIDAAHLDFAEVAADASDSNRQPWRQAILNEVLILFDETGKVIDQVTHPQSIKARGESLAQLKRHGIDQQLDMPVPRPGPYQLRAAVLDVHSKRTGSAAQFVEVPDLKLKRLALSSVVVSSTAFSEKKDPAGHPSQRIIRPGGDLEYATFVYNATVAKENSEPNLITQIRLFREGTLVFTGRKNPLRAEAAKAAPSLTLKGKMQVSQPGDYLLEVAVQDLAAPAKQQFAIRTIDFHVRPVE